MNSFLLLCDKFPFIFGRNRSQQKDISKLTDLYSDQILDKLTNWWLEFLLLLVLHTSDWMRNEVSVRTVRTMVGFVKNRPTIWPTIVVHKCQIRNGHYRHFGGGALTNFYQCPGLYQSLDIIWTSNNFLLHGQYVIGNFRFHFDQVNIDLSSLSLKNTWVTKKTW